MRQIIIYFPFAVLCLIACNHHQAGEKKNAATMPENIRFKNGYSDVNGIKMYFEIHGQGEPLVLIHGGGSTINTSFARIIPLLSKYQKVIAMELQAHGRTSDRDTPESFEQDADDVVALLHNLEISNASFLGFSNGGNTAIQIANRHPGIVNKLILASTFYKREGFVTGFFEGMKQATLKDMPQSLKDAFLQVNPDSTKLETMFNKDRDRMVSFKDWSDETLIAIKAPTLIINGDHDVVVPAHSLTMSRLILDSRMMILPATHGTYIGAVESGDANIKLLELTAEIIKEFLSR